MRLSSAPGLSLSAHELYGPCAHSLKEPQCYRSSATTLTRASTGLSDQGAASAATDPVVKSQLSDLEVQWRHVAKSYEFIVSLEKFLLDAHKNALPHEVEQLPKGGT